MIERPNRTIKRSTDFSQPCISIHDAFAVVVAVSVVAVTFVAVTVVAVTVVALKAVAVRAFAVVIGVTVDAFAVVIVVVAVTVVFFYSVGLWSLEGKNSMLKKALLAQDKKGSTLSRLISA